MALSALLALSLALPAAATSRIGPYELAYTARIYYPDTDKRLSRYQVYLSDLRGRHRRQVTFGKAWCWDVRWAGPNTIIWIESTNEASVVMSANLPDLEPRALWRGEYIEFLSDWRGRRVRGKPVVSVDGTFYRFQDGRPARVPEPPFGEYVFEKGHWILLGLLAIEMRDPQTGRLLLDTYPDRNAEFKRNGVSVKGLVKGTLYDVWPVAGGDKSLLRSYEDGELHAGFDFYYLIDWKAKSFRPLVLGLTGVDLSPGDRIYAGLTDGGRDLRTRDDHSRTLWIAGIEAGDLKTGKRWRVLGGWAYAGSVSVRHSDSQQAAALPRELLKAVSEVTRGQKPPGHAPNLNDPTFRAHLSHEHR